MISFNDVTFTYPGADRPVFRSLNLEILPGDFVLVMGPSGAGKSTLLRCLNGLVPHFSGGTLRGAIRVAGYDPVQVSPRVMSRQVGFVFQDPETQFVVDRVEDEVAFALENLALPPAEIAARLDTALGLVGLAGLRQRRLDTLSGGEQQRVALASVLALNPSLLALDEPTSQLDPASAQDLLQTLVRLNQELGLTIVLAEHRLERVLPYVNRIIYMGGDTDSVLVGEPRQVLQQVELVPPLITIGKRLNWQPLPLTIQEARRFAEAMQVPVNSSSAPPHQTLDGREIALQIENLHVFYDSQPALKGVDLTIRCSEILVLMGSNGAGKTTLLRSLLGLHKPEAGKIALFGQSVLGEDPARLSRQIGYLPQDPNSLLFADRVIDELLFTLRNRELRAQKLNRGQAQAWEMNANARAAGLLNQMGMADLAAVYPRDLSVGQRQWVALAAIMVAGPRILMLDEPTRGLDPAAKLRLAELLRGWRAAGHAILLVTHDVELAARLADRIALLEAGRLIANGQPLEVFSAHPPFAPQILQLYPRAGCLTPEQLFARLRSER